MSRRDFDEAWRLVIANPNRCSFVGPRDATLLIAAEKALGAKLPPMYRDFVERLGAGNFGAFEVYGIVSEEFEKSSVPNGIWLTLDERRTSGLPSDLAIIGSTGDGDWFCIELGETDKPVFIWQPGYSADEQRPPKVAEDFGAFLLQGIKKRLASAGG